MVSAFQLIVLRGLLGVFDGGLLPSANALIAKQRRTSRRARAQGTRRPGYLANGLGFALGPLTGGLIAAGFGLRSVFYVTAAILLAIGVYLPFGIRDTPARPRPSSVDQSKPAPERNRCVAASGQRNQAERS